MKEHASKAQPYVKQAKILRDPERVDPADGLPRSRGLGFVEFTEHEHAICALRQLNNNPAPFGNLLLLSQPSFILACASCTKTAVWKAYL